MTVAPKKRRSGKKARMQWASRILMVVSIIVILMMIITTFRFSVEPVQGAPTSIAIPANY